MGITKTKHSPIEKFENYPLLLHGERGIGKTTLAAEFDKPYFLMFEPNNEYALYKDNITTWEELIDKLEDFEKGDHDFKTIVFDNVNNFVNIVCDHVLDDYNQSVSVKEQVTDLNKGGLGFGVGYERVDKMILKLIRFFMFDVKFGVVFITHSEIRKIETLKTSFEKITPRFPNKRSRALFMSEVSNIFYYYTVGSARYLQIAPDDTVVAKNRGTDKHFKTVKGESIINIPAGDSAEKTYKYIQAAYNNKLKRTYRTIA